jgi:hypothetical protein
MRLSPEIVAMLGRYGAPFHDGTAFTELHRAEYAWHGSPADPPKIQGEARGIRTAHLWPKLRTEEACGSQTDCRSAQARGSSQLEKSRRSRRLSSATSSRK